MYWPVQSLSAPIKKATVRAGMEHNQRRLKAAKAPSIDYMSVFFRQHDCDHSLGDRRIGWVGRVKRALLVQITDCEKDQIACRLRTNQSRALQDDTRAHSLRVRR